MCSVAITDHVKMAELYPLTTAALSLYVFTSTTDLPVAANSIFFYNTVISGTFLLLLAIMAWACEDANNFLSASPPTPDEPSSSIPEFKKYPTPQEFLDESRCRLLFSLPPDHPFHKRVRDATGELLPVQPNGRPRPPIDMGAIRRRKTLKANNNPEQPAYILERRQLVQMWNSEWDSDEQSDEYKGSKPKMRILKRKHRLAERREGETKDDKKKRKKKKQDRGTKAQFAKKDNNTNYVSDMTEQEEVNLRKILEDDDPDFMDTAEPSQNAGNDTATAAPGDRRYNVSEQSASADINIRSSRNDNAATYPALPSDSDSPTKDRATASQDTETLEAPPSPYHFDSEDGTNDRLHTRHEAEGTAGGTAESPHGGEESETLSWEDRIDPVLLKSFRE